MASRRTNRTRTHALLFWILFWACAALLLFAWWLFLNRSDVRLVANALFGSKHTAVTETVTDTVRATDSPEVVAVAQDPSIRDNAPLSALMRYFMQRDGKQRTFLLLLQNNMEIRPGGGYIGSFGIVRVRDGALVGTPEVHDLSNFDGRIADDEVPPYPMPELLGVHAWKMRDSNWSPDFATNAQKALHFYYKGQGAEQFDGVIGVTTDILTDLLMMTGPVSVPGYPGTFDARSGVLALEHQVEQGFVDQGIAKGERKSIMPLLAQEILAKINFKNPIMLVQLLMLSLHSLEEKDIQLYFTDAAMQAQMQSAGWTGSVDTTWDKDYIMIVDANMGALKTDASIVRSARYSLDMTGDVPHATLILTYTNTATTRDYMTSDYRTYTRVYVPADAWIESIDGATGVAQFAQDFGKKSVGFLVNVPLGTTKTVTLHYTLPAARDDMTTYDLMLQKQSGTTFTPFTVDIITPNGTSTRFAQDLVGDTTLSAL